MSVFQTEWNNEFARILHIGRNDETATNTQTRAPFAVPRQRVLNLDVALSDESRQLCSDLFTKLDKNKNGYLEKNEVNRATTKMHSYMAPAARWDWAEMDANKDGVISLTEWLAFFDAKVKDVGFWQEGEVLAAITRWCEHEAEMEKEVEAARKISEDFEKGIEKITKVKRNEIAVREAELGNQPQPQAGKSVLIYIKGENIGQVVEDENITKDSPNVKEVQLYGLRWTPMTSH
jgi:hypothetical protein